MCCSTRALLPNSDFKSSVMAPLSANSTSMKSRMNTSEGCDSSVRLSRLSDEGREGTELADTVTDINLHLTILLYRSVWC